MNSGVLARGYTVATRHLSLAGSNTMNFPLRILCSRRNLDHPSPVLFATTPVQINFKGYFAIVVIEVAIPQSAQPSHPVLAVNSGGTSCLRNRDVLVKLAQTYDTCSRSLLYRTYTFVRNSVGSSL